MYFDEMNAATLEQASAIHADPDISMRRLVRSLLYDMGMRHIREASDGEQALKELHLERADLVITGWTMEPMGGIDLIKALRRHTDSPCPGARIILLTAHTSQQNVIQARDAGVTDVLAKPISKTVFNQRISSALGTQLSRTIAPATTA